MAEGRFGSGEDIHIASINLQSKEPKDQQRHDQKVEPDTVGVLELGTAILCD